MHTVIVCLRRRTTTCGGGSLSSYHRSKLIVVFGFKVEKSPPPPSKSLAKPHSSEPHEGIYSHFDLFLMRLIILWHVDELSSLKLQQHRTKNDEVIVDGHVRW